MKKSQLFCFAGIDGSGKTTAAQKLTVVLKERGIDADYVYGIFRPRLVAFIMWFGRLFFTGGINKEREYDTYSHFKKSSLSKMRWVKYPYLSLLLMDIFLELMGRFGWKLLCGKTIVIDRYFYDGIINFFVNLSEDPVSATRMIARFGKFFPHPTAYFLLDVPEEIAMSRKKDVPSITYLRERRPYYLALADALNMKVLDGTKSIEEIQYQVKRDLGLI